MLKSKRMRNQKTLIAVVAFLLLFSSVANAGWWDDIKGCFEEPEKKDIGVNKVKEYCDSAKSKVKGATGSIKDDIDSANRATGNIDRALEDYNSICGGFCTTEQLAECNGMGEINCTGDLCCSFCTDDKLNACQNIGDSESCVADPCCSWGGDGGLCESVEIFALCVPDEPLSIGSIDDKLDEADAKIDDTLAGVDDKVNDMVSCSPEKLAECSGKDAQSCEGICCSLCTEEELDECFNEEDPESCNDDPCCTLDAEQCKSGAGAESCLPRKRSLIEELSDTYDDVKTKIDESPEAVGSVKKDFGEMCDVIADGCSSKQLAECSGRQEQECTGDICCSFCTEEKLNGCPDIEDSGLCVDDSCCSWNDVGGFCESVEIFALCVPDEPLSVDGAMGEIDAELTDLEVWLSGLPDEADEIINQNGGENSTYAKFKIMHNKLNSVYEKLAYIRGLYIEVGGVCGQAIDVVRGQIGCTAEQIAQANCSDKDTVGCIEELCCSFCTDDKLNACSDIGDSKLCIDDTCCSWGGDEQGCGSVVENASCVPVGQSGISKSLDKLREQCITVEETIQEEIMDPVETLIFGCTTGQIAQANCGGKDGPECSQEPCCSFCTDEKLDNCYTQDPESCNTDSCCFWDGDGGFCESVADAQSCIPAKASDSVLSDLEELNLEEHLDEKLTRMCERVQKSITGCTDEEIDAASCDGDTKDNCEDELCCSFCTEEKLEECEGIENPESCVDDPCCKLNGEQCKSVAGAESCVVDDSPGLISGSNNVICDSSKKLLPLMDEALDVLDVFMGFWNKMQRYGRCYECLEDQIDNLGTRKSTFEAQSSETCNQSYIDSKAMYVEFFNSVNKKKSNEYLFAIYQDPEFEANAQQADKEAEDSRGQAIAYLEFDPAVVSNAEGCDPDATSAAAYERGSDILRDVSGKAGKAKFTLYAALAKEFLGAANAFVDVIGKLADVLGIGSIKVVSDIISVVIKALNIFLGVFNVLTGTCQKIADSEEKVDELTVANKEADKLRNWVGTPYVELSIMDEAGIPTDPNVQEFAYTFYGVFSSPKDMYDRSPESYGEVEVSTYMRPIYPPKPEYIEFIEEWNKNLGYDVVEIIKEMPVTATTSPVVTKLDYGPGDSKKLVNNPTPICTVESLFRTQKSKGKEGWVPLEMSYDDHEVMWTEIFGITPDIEMRDSDCNILIYNFASEVGDTYLDLSEILKDDNYPVQYRERAGNDITGEMLSDYCQAWFIDSEEESVTPAEIDVIGNFLNEGGNILLTGDSESFSNIEQIAAAFGVEISGFDIGEEGPQFECDVPTSAQCIYPSFIPHEVTNGVTSISSHGLSIKNSDFDEICTHSENPCTIFSDDGGGKMIFDSSSERFSSVLECENSRYVRNIARFLSLERWSKTGDIKVYAGGGCTRYNPGTNIKDHHLHCENPLTLIEDIWSPKAAWWLSGTGVKDYFCSWQSDKTVCWKGGDDRGTLGWYHGPIEDQVEVTVVYKDEEGVEHRNSSIKKGKPHMDDEDTVNSYFVVGVEIPKEARTLSIEAKYSCTTTFNRQVFHVKCEEKCMLNKNAAFYNWCYYIPFVGNFYNNGKNVGCVHANTETIMDTSSVQDTWDEIDSWMDADALVRDGEMTSLGVDMDGTIRPSGDEGWMADLTLRATPDIISSFSMTVGEHSFIDHQENFYPVKHELFRRYSTTGPEKKEYNIIDGYGIDSSEYNYPQQCKKICPLLECECPDSILEPFCWDLLSDTGYSVRTDCACLPREGQEDLCVSDRSFHEDVGVYYDFVRLTAYDINEMSLMGYTPTKTISGGLLTANEINKENGFYPISFTTGTMTDDETGETIHVTEDELRNAEIIVYTPVEATGAKTLSQWMNGATTSIPTTTTSDGTTTSIPTTTTSIPLATTTASTTTTLTTIIYDTCTLTCDKDPKYKACDVTNYAYCRASCGTGEETPSGLDNVWCQSQTAIDLGVSAPGYVCCCCCAGWMGWLC